MPVYSQKGLKFCEKTLIENNHLCLDETASASMLTVDSATDVSMPSATHISANKCINHCRAQTGAKFALVSATKCSCASATTIDVAAPSGSPGMANIAIFFFFPMSDANLVREPINSLSLVRILFSPISRSK